MYFAQMMCKFINMVFVTLTMPAWIVWCVIYFNKKIKEKHGYGLRKFAKEVDIKEWINTEEAAEIMRRAQCWFMGIRP